MENILITGVAGFIGMHVARQCLERGGRVVGLDNLNPYYDVALKKARLSILETYGKFRFVEGDIEDANCLVRIFDSEKLPLVLHLAAQVGVRYSVSNPSAYVGSNLAGFLNVLEACRHARVRHLVFASSSSVYGGNTLLPFREDQNVDHPISLYAATKKANELMAHSYSHLFGLPATGLRLFTVYGPWGRPDMALTKFAHAIVRGQEIELYNGGQMLRDFTYVDDVVDAVLKILSKPPSADPDFNTAAPNPSSSNAPFRILNVGGDTPVELAEFVRMLERALETKATAKMMPNQPGDVVATHADISALRRTIGFTSTTSLQTGITRFVEWYRSYYFSARS